MGVEFESGYSLPGADEPLTHARILHKNNRIRMKSLVASDTSALAASVMDNALTFERWKPFANLVAGSSVDLSVTETTLDGVDLSADNQTITEDASTGNHRAYQSVTTTAQEYIFAAKVDRNTCPEIRLLVTDGTNHACYFDLRDATVGTAVNSTGNIEYLGNDKFLCRIYFTALAASGNFQVLMSNGSETASYTGDSTTALTVLEWYFHPSIATVDFTPFTSEEADVFCLASHNLGTSGGRVTIEHGAGHTDIMGASITPTDNAPIMAIFEPLTPTEWRMTVDRAVLPEIGIVRWGKALQMSRPIFGGVKPLDLARKTTMRSNKSTTGEWLGRTKLRTELATSFEWTNIEDTWVYTNWPTFQTASEDEPFFLAWRPTTYSSVGYCSTQTHDEPANIGTRNLMSVSMTVTGFLNV